LTPFRMKTLPSRFAVTWTAVRSQSRALFHQGGGGGARVRRGETGQYWRAELRCPSRLLGRRGEPARDVDGDVDISRSRVPRRRIGDGDCGRVSRRRRIFRNGPMTRTSCMLRHEAAGIEPVFFSGGRAAGRISSRGGMRDASRRRIICCSYDSKSIMGFLLTRTCGLGLRSGGSVGGFGRAL